MDLLIEDLKIFSEKNWISSHRGSGDLLPWRSSPPRYSPRSFAKLLLNDPEIFAQKIHRFSNRRSIDLLWRCSQICTTSPRRSSYKIYGDLLIEDFFKSDLVIFS